MCAVAGFLGTSDPKTAQVLHHLAYFGEERGGHSSGIALIQPATNYLLQKDTVTGGELFNRYHIKEWIVPNKDTICFVHNRWATTGAITPHNAHPFVEGKFLFAHNGIITNFFELQKQNNTQYEVDSQIIGFLLNQYKNVQHIFARTLQGSYVVPYIHTDRPLELNIVRHDNPISVAMSVDGSKMFYASLSRYLEGALLLNDLQDQYKIYQLKNNTLYQFKFTHNRITTTAQKIKVKYDTYYDTYTGEKSLHNAPEGLYVLEK